MRVVNAVTESDIPVWMHLGRHLRQWPTEEVTDSLADFCVRIPSHWTQTQTISHGELETEFRYPGPMVGEALSVTHMPVADPTAEIVGWVATNMILTGAPNPSVWGPEGTPPTMVLWSGPQTSAGLQKRLEMDVLLFYEGVASYAEERNQLNRVYLLTCRRGTQAWKVCLSFNTACPPGTPPAMIADNDHGRAQACLAMVELGVLGSRPPSGPGTQPAVVQTPLQKTVAGELVQNRASTKTAT